MSVTPSVQAHLDGPKGTEMRMHVAQIDRGKSWVSFSPRHPPGTSLSPSEVHQRSANGSFLQQQNHPSAQTMLRTTLGRDEKYIVPLFLFGRLSFQSVCSIRQLLLAVVVEAVCPSMRHRVPRRPVNQRHAYPWPLLQRRFTYFSGRRVSTVSLIPMLAGTMCYERFFRVAVVHRLRQQCPALGCGPPVGFGSRTRNAAAGLRMLSNT